LLLENGADPNAVYKNKTMVEYAEICKDNDQVAQMVWEELSERL
jgi:hypothetical protein